jgi:hypothetical protein
MRLGIAGSGRGWGTRDAVRYNGQRMADGMGRDRWRGTGLDLRWGTGHGRGERKISFDLATKQDPAA